MKIFAIIGLSLATAITGVAPAQAFPAMERSKIVTSDVQTVESYRSSWGRGRYGGNRIYRRHYRGDYYGGWRRDRGDYYGGWRGNRRYYNNDIGAAFGGFAAGAIIGGMLAQPRYYAPRYGSRRYYSGGSHVDWCYARYRSYRASDNTYQPYNGPRRRCLGP